MARGAELDDVQVMRLDREEFLRDYWAYKTGEHVTILAPTGGGKTYLGYQLLAETMTVEVPAIVFVMKPKDATVTTFGKKLELRTVRQWPPPPSDKWLRKKPRGYVLWPKFTYDPDIDEPRHHAIFRSALLDSYRVGDRIVFGDETYSLEEELNLTTELRTLWTKGRSARCGLWAATQRPAYVSKWAYQAHHLFIGNDPDDDARRRLSEIGAAVDKLLVRKTVASLSKQEFLYINRDDRTLCIVGR